MRCIIAIGFLLSVIQIVQAQGVAKPTRPIGAALAADTTLQLQGQRQPVRPFLTVQDQLRTVAGVQVTPYDGSPGSGQVVRVRGATALAGSGQPLYVVDGLPALNDELAPAAWLSSSPVPTPYSASAYQLPSVAAQGSEAGANPLQLLPPESIASVEVLAGPAAVARYGPLAANGVVSIRTRLATGGADSLRWHLRYAAYGGVQQVRRRLPLLDAANFAAIANEAALNNGVAPPLASPPTGAGTDWQAETYRLAGLQQHELSLLGQGRRTGVLASLDYRQQGGVLRNASLSRFGLRLALAHRASERLRLQASAALGQTDQRLPYTFDGGGAVQAALTAPPVEPVRTAQDSYAGYGGYARPLYTPNAFVNPVAVAELEYRTPRTRRLLAQAGASYQLGAGLVAELAANYQLTDLLADQYNFAAPAALGVAPSSSQLFASQTYANQQLAARLAVRYERAVGPHRLGAELALHYLHYDYRTRYDLSYGGLTQPSYHSYYEQGGQPTLAWPWLGLRYALADSVLTAEASLSYARAASGQSGALYPSAQLRWQPRAARLPLALWLGAGRTSAAGNGYGLFGPAVLTRPVSSFTTGLTLQQPQLTDQLEAGLRLGRPGAALSGQLVGYYRRTQHALLPTAVLLPFASGSYGYTTRYDEGRVHNLGLELTLTAAWQAGPLAGVTRLAASANRNRVQPYDDSSRLNPAFADHPAAAFYGLRQQGLNADGTLRFASATGSGPAASAERQYLGSGIPAGLLSVSQQLRLRRFALDAQLDALLGYQVLNYQLATLDVPTGSQNAAPTVLDRWTPTHTATDVPAAGRTYPFSVAAPDYYSDRLLESGNQLRLSSLTLSYQLRPVALAGLSVWAGTQNLFVLSSYRGYDPNVSSGGSAALLAGQDYGAVPVPRVWLLGVRAAL